MARSEQQQPVEDGTDLHARIQAQISARRRGGSPGELSVADLQAAQHQAGQAANIKQNGHLSRTAERAAAVHAGGRRSRPGLRDRPEAPPRGRHGQPSAPPTRTSRVARFALLIAITLAAVFGLRSYVIASYYIPSASMETTLHGCPTCEPDMVLVDKVSYRVMSISRTDVVVFNRPPLAPPEDKQLIKRVIGLPGDVVSGHGGHVYIGSRELSEPYVNPACHGTADFGPVTVPAGHYFMMGDNRCDSFDSRLFGAIPRSAVVGRAFAVIWPVKHLRWL